MDELLLDSYIGAGPPFSCPVRWVSTVGESVQPDRTCCRPVETCRYRRWNQSDSLLSDGTVADQSGHQRSFDTPRHCLLLQWRNLSYPRMTQIPHRKRLLTSLYTLCTLTAPLVQCLAVPTAQSKHTQIWLQRRQKVWAVARRFQHTPFLLPATSLILSIGVGSK
jgi:hypothetical protein